MLIKLQPDQISLFWDMIRQTMLSVYKIPRKFQQSFATKILELLMSGLSQCWLGYVMDGDGEKKLHYIMVTKIVDDSQYGIRILVIDTLYGFRFISDKLVDEGIDLMEEYARANKCDAMAAESLGDRPREMLMRRGFEEHQVVYRKFLT